MQRKVFSIVIILAVIVSGVVFMAKYNKGHDVFYGDSLGYYVYLPATFIFNNLQDMDQLPEEDSLGNGVYYYVNTMKSAGRAIGQEHWVNQYTYGIALMELPFFLGAHLYEKAAGLPATGYSKSYNNALMLAALVYGLLGLILVSRVLRHYFSHISSLISTVLVLMGTNIFWFMFRQGGMSHIPLFFLYALLLYLTVKVHQRSKRWQLLLIGFTVGLITVIRPTDIICLLIPFLYGVYNKESWQKKTVFLKENAASIGFAAIAFIIPVIPQLLYWQLTAGQPVYYSYGSQSFDWADPHIIEGLFSFDNGWLPYAPVMVFALSGLLLYKHYKPFFPAILILLPVYIYIIYSWWCYNYINGFGSRPMIHLYPLLSIPLAALIQFVIHRAGMLVNVLFTGVCLLFVGVIFSLSSLMAQNKFISEDANAPFYFGMLFKSSLSYESMVEYNVGEFQPGESNIQKSGTLISEEFTDSVNEHYITDTATGKGYTYLLMEGDEYYPGGLSVIYNKQQFKGAKWIKCSGRFMYADVGYIPPRLLVLSVLREGSEALKWQSCVIDNKIGISDSSCSHNDGSVTLRHFEPGMWGTVYFYSQIPDDIQDGDKLVMDVWNMPQKILFVDDLKMELYK